MMPDTETPLTSIRARIQAACAAAGRPPEAVTLLAVSKTRGPDEIAALADQGQRHFGENYLQEALDKMPALAGRDLIWHFIGPASEVR